MPRFVRVECVCTSDNWDPLYVDAVIDEQGAVKFGPPWCGWWGKVRSTDMAPFVAKVIREDSLTLGYYALDFGSDEDTDQSGRFTTFDLFHGPVVLARSFFLYHEGERLRFVVKTITDMLEGELVN